MSVLSDSLRGATARRGRVKATRSRADTGRRKEEIYQTLRERIVFAELRSRESLNETRLALELGVSRTLLREVIQRLVREEILAASSGQGVYVEPIDLILMRNALEVRGPLEELAGRLAVERARLEHLDQLRDVIRKGETALAAGDYKEVVRLDQHFHSALGDATRNPKLTMLLGQLLIPFNRLWYIAMAEFGQVGDVIGDWRRVLVALEERSGPNAAAALVAHMNAALVFEGSPTLARALGR